MLLYPHYAQRFHPFFAPKPAQNRRSAATEIPHLFPLKQPLKSGVNLDLSTAMEPLGLADKGHAPATPAGGRHTPPAVQVCRIYPVRRGRCASSANNKNATPTMHHVFTPFYKYHLYFRIGGRRLRRGAYAATKFRASGARQ